MDPSHLQVEGLSLHWLLGQGLVWVWVWVTKRFKTRRRTDNSLQTPLKRKVCRSETTPCKASQPTCIRSRLPLDLLSLTQCSPRLGTGALVSGGMTSRSREGRTGTICGSERVGFPQNRFGFVLMTVPARQIAVMTPSPTVSETPRRKDQDMGGFPGPIELFQRFVRTGALGPIERAWNRIAAYGRKHRRHPYLSWIPDSIDGLIVGRNSEFNTDQLTDEQLEHLGGIEYRALRFLSYFIFAVSAEIVPPLAFSDCLQTSSISWPSTLYHS